MTNLATPLLLDKVINKPKKPEIVLPPPVVKKQTAQREAVKSSSKASKNVRKQASQRFGQFDTFFAGPESLLSNKNQNSLLGV